MTGMRSERMDGWPGHAVARSCGLRSQVVRSAPEVGQTAHFEVFWLGNFAAWARNCSIRTQAAGFFLSQVYVR